MSETLFTIDKEALTVTIERVFDAPRQVVWNTITNPDLIPKWWGPEKYPTIVDHMDVAVGGKWRFINEDSDGNTFAFSGEYKEVEPPVRLVQTFNFEPIGPGHESVEVATLEETAVNQTKLSITSHYKTIEDLEGTIQSGMEGGARETWERLVNLIQSEYQETV